LFHRFGTLSHILASTELSCRKNEVVTDEVLIEKNAVAIVKAMQKLRGIDGEYDSDSATSNRLAHRKTIHMLEKNRHKKRAIGTLDVAFKKRFLAFTGAPGEGGPDGNIPMPGMGGGKPYGGFYAGKGSQTPILGSRLPIRRETMKTALEHHFEHVEERKQSKMQTLGASNPHNNNKDKHRQNAKITADTVGEIFNVGPGGNDNPGFVDGINPGGLNAVLGGGGSSNTDDEASSTTRNSSTKFSRSRESSHPHQQPTNSLMWKERRRERHHDVMGGGANISDHNSTSTTSKM
jgi:chitin synthase